MQSVLVQPRRVPPGATEQQRAEYHDSTSNAKRARIGFRRQVLKILLAENAADPNETLRRWIDRERERGTKIRNGTREIVY